MGTAVLSLNQAYFMALFFFISAYFSWISYERKSAKEFLAARYQRLGIPFLVYFFVGGPLLSLFINRVVLDRSFSYFPDPGPPWFLAVLLMFNEAFVFVDTETFPSWSWEVVKIRHLVGLGVVLGAVQCAQMIFAPVYLFMPITFGSLPFDLLFFAAGLQAGKNDWFDKAIPAFASSSRAAIRSICVIMIAVVFGLCGMMYARGGGWYMTFHNECDEAKDSGGSPVGALMVLAFAVVLGVFCMTFSVAIIDLFNTKLNVRNDWTTFLSTSSYAVYLFHPFVVVPITWSYTKILESANGFSGHEDVDLVFLHNDTYSTSCVKEIELWIGSLYVAFASVVVVFLLSFYVLKRTPLLKYVL